MSRGKRSKKKNRTMLDLQVVTLIIASILLTILIYTKAGYIGQTLSPILGGIMGWIKYIIPVGTFAIAIFLACDEDKDNFMKKILQYAVFLLCITTIITVIQISQGKLSTANGFEEAIKQAYYNGSKNIGGGAVGAICAIGLINLVGKIGTVIIAIGIAIIDSIFLFGIKPAELLKEYIETRNEKKQEAKAQRIEQRKLRADKEVIPKEKEEKKKKSKIMPEDNIVTEDQINIKMANNNEEQTSLFKKQEEIKEDKSKEILTLEHALTVEDENYEFPPVEFLTPGKTATKMGKKAVTDTANKLQKTLYSFGVSAKVENVSVGPTITRYELKPAEGVRVSKIANLADDIALSLAAETIRIEAPIPGKQAVGIEIPNKEKEVVHLRDIIDSNEFKNAKSKLSFALGKNAAGEAIVTDIAKMPHVLIAGSTGSGKSVCINTLITSIIYKAKPSEVKLVMVDPKVVELSVYNGIPHLLIPVVTDPKKAAGALAWAVQEMVNRYHLFAEKNVRDIAGYNEALEKEGAEGKLPQIVIIIDELADLMMVAKNDVEDAICRLAQMARAAGMHLVIATQRPSVDVITGIIKANIASRISFAVTSQVDSRTILDSAGAEKLLGKGDMLFFPTGVLKPIRIQGAFVSDSEVEKIVSFLKENGGPTYSEDVLEKIERANSTDKELDEQDDDETDPFLMEAIDTVVDLGQASASFIQRRFKVGYARAGRIIDQMEARGIISGYEGSKPRQVLVSKEQWQELKMAKPVGPETESEE
ncbi:MAG: DNA translocase FtsK [Clostridia bacterium]|jgi:S-DNA-T family DNA segregation ATPase FtsK/SpoIIIE|nr:dNA segregation ATPase FtsK/SpoIIIE family [Clostridium sp. CAG:452]